MSNFNWYNASSSSSSQPELMMNRDSFNQQPLYFDDRSSLPPHVDQSFNQSYERPPQHFDETLPQQFSNLQTFDGTSSLSHPQQVHDFVLPHQEGNNIYIHADNVIIQGGDQHGEGPIPVVRADNHDHHDSHDTVKTGTTSEVNKSTTVTDKEHNSSSSGSNPLGVPSAHQQKPISEGHPPSQTSQQATTTASTPSSSVPSSTLPPSSSAAPLTHGSAADKVVPPLSTDNSHTSTMPSSNIAPAPNTTPLPPSSSSTPLPPSSSTGDSTTSVQTSANDHPPVGTKSEKKHRSIKDRYKELKMKLHGGSAGVSGDVHPKDSRDGKTLPSQNELSQRQVTEPQGNSADHPVIHKDANDATGKTVTGSDANPSKASMPFKVPTPSANQPPVDAKAQ